MAKSNSSVSTSSSAPNSTSGSTNTSGNMPTSFLKGSYMNLPPETRGLITLVGAGIVLYIGYKVYKLIKDTSGGVVSKDKGNKQEDKEWSSESDRLNQDPKTRATISNAQALSYANSLHAAMDGYGTDEGTIYSVFRKIKNSGDFALLMNAYGVREISSGAWNPEPNFNGTLVGALTSELSSEDKGKVNKILQSKKIEYKV